MNSHQIRHFSCKIATKLYSNNGTVGQFILKDHLPKTIHSTKQMKSIEQHANKTKAHTHVRKQVSLHRVKSGHLFTKSSIQCESSSIKMVHNVPVFGS